MRHVVMFSSGVGSAVSARLITDRYPDDETTLLFADVNGEDEDNYRFLHEAAAWAGGKLVILDNGGKTIWDVFREARFLGNTRVDPCSRVLKREPMRAWLDEFRDPADTVIYLGFDWTEEHRLARARPHWEPWTVEAPLTWDPIMDKADAIQMMKLAGIEAPLLTRMGYPHANCKGGCIKAGQKQFRKLGLERPEVYQEWVDGEQMMQKFLGRDVTVLRDRRGGATKPLSLETFRDMNTDDGDWGSCGCMGDFE